LKHLPLVILLLALASCSFFKKKGGTGEKGVLARVNDEYLYVSDVQTMVRGLKGNDSLAALKEYTENWVRKKLLLQKAMDNIAADDPGITRKVEEYRDGLILYEYEKALINKRLDTTVSDGQLEDWYSKMKEGMVLEKDVYRVYFIKLKKDAPDLADMRKWVTKPKDDEDLRKMEGYSKAYATTFNIDSGMWYDKENLLKNFPLDEAALSALTTSKSYKEFKSDDQTIFIKITGMLKKDQPAPMEFMRDKLARAIIEKRRVDLIERIYDKIYQDGIKSKSFEIFVK
jgi:phage tail tube protein FII